MSLPAPVQGLVIRYSYLWRRDFLAGNEEGVKDRPCAVILTVRSEDGEDIVTVLPITRSPQNDPRTAIELPAATKRRLGLDAVRSWVVLDEANQFIWPGPDLRPVPGKARFDYGLLPADLMNEIRDKVIALLKARRVASARRTR